MFHPISVRLDPETEARLRQLADRLGMTQSQVVREAVAAYAAGQRTDGVGSAYERLRAWIACVPAAGSARRSRRTLADVFKEKARARGRAR